MSASQLRKGTTLCVRDAAPSPSIEGLRSLSEISANRLGADGVNQVAVGVSHGSHARLYQRRVYISSGQSFIGLTEAVRQKLRMPNDPAFGDRLRDLIGKAGFKNPRKFALDGMGWGADSGPQRLNNYLKGRLPTLEIAVAMAGKLNVTLHELLDIDFTEEADDSLHSILRNLLELEGISPAKADTIASASLAAQRLLQKLPDDDPAQVRAKYAAHAVWHQQH